MSAVWTMRKALSFNPMPMWSKAKSLLISNCHPAVNDKNWEKQ